MRRNIYCDAIRCGIERGLICRSATKRAAAEPIYHEHARNKLPLCDVRPAFCNLQTVIVIDVGALLKIHP
jgi:hypothetical protein